MNALLPLEVVEHIVDQCAYSHASLHNLSLSCRDLRPHAHRHLFRSVKLMDMSGLYAFAQLLDMKPQLRRSVRVITFHEAYGETESRTLLGMVPAALLTQLPNLRQWVVKSRKRDIHEEPLWISFRLLSLASLGTCSRNIQTLELDAVSFSTCSDFVLYVSSFPQIRTLSCTRVQVKEAVLTNGALMDRLRGRLRLQNLVIREVAQRAPIGLIGVVVFSTLENLSFDVDALVEGPMSSYATEFSQMSQIRSITVIIPPAYPDPLHAWTEINRICENISCVSSTLRRLRIETAPRHIRDLITGRSGWFEDVQMCQWMLKSQMEGLFISVPDERANGVDECATALRSLFPTLHARGLLMIEFPLQRPPGHIGAVSVVAVSSDSRWLATASEDETIIIWDVQENTILREWAVGAPVTFLAFSPDSERLASPRCGARGFDAAIWSVQDGVLLGSFSGHTAPIATCIWSPDDIKLASMAREGPDTIRVWDAETHEQVYVLRDAFRIPTCAYIQFSPDGRWLHVASPHPKITVCRVWNADTGEPYRVLGHKHFVTTANFVPTGRLLATASEEGSIFLWRMKTMEWMEVVLSEAQTHPCARLATIAFSQDGTQVLLAWAALSTVMVQIWDPVGGDRLMSLEGHRASVLSLCFSPDATYVASGSSDKSVRLWRLRDGSCAATFVEHESGVGHVSFSPDGEALCSGAWDGSVVIRRLRHLIARRNA